MAGNWGKGLVGEGAAPNFFSAEDLGGRPLPEVPTSYSPSLEW